MLAHILKGYVELVAHLVADDAADANTAGVGQTLQSGGEIDSVAENVALVDDDVALMDAEAELDPLVRGTSALRAAISRCTSTAQRTASTTLANSTSKPSPVVLTMRPRCSAILGSISSARIDLSRSRVPSSSAPINREYPATSAARIAARRRLWVMTLPPPPAQDLI